MLKILQARLQQYVNQELPDESHHPRVCVCAQSLSRIRLFVTPWTVASQAPLSMAFSRQEYWGGLPFPPPGDVPDPGIEPASSVSRALQADSFTTEDLSPCSERCHTLSPKAHPCTPSAAAKSLQSCPTRCHPVDGSPPGSPVPGILQETFGAGSIPGSGKCPGGGHGNPLQYSCLDNPMNRGAWWATVHGVAESQAQLSTHKKRKK